MRNKATYDKVMDWSLINLNRRGSGKKERRIDLGKVKHLTELLKKTN